MADDNLDDFFAKKDKSKKKSKSKIKPDDILAQEDAPAKPKKKKSKTPKQTESEGNIGDKINQEDEDWKEFEEEQEVDLTGLRIKEMQVSKDEEVEEEEEQGQEEGDGLERKEGGPWKQMADGSMPKPAAKQVHEESRKTPDPVPTPEAPPADTPKPSLGKYVPPSRRGAGAESGGSGQVITPNPLGAGGRRKKKEAPNLRSEQDFPTLGGGPGGGESGGWFEEVKSGGRQADDPSKQRLNLQLDNKFGALEDNDS